MPKRKPIGQFVPLVDAAVRVGLSRHTLWRMARRGVIKAVQINRSWHIHFGDLWGYVNDPKVNASRNARARHGR